MVGAMALAVVTIGFPQKSLGESFTGQSFLAWSEDGQNTYIQTAVTMATFVISRSNLEISDCLNAWYAGSEATLDERNSFIRSKIARNAEYHPSAVILVVLEDVCGSFAQK